MNTSFIEHMAALKTDTQFETSLSRGRKENTEVGNGSFAFGGNVTASGNYSHAEGHGTTASEDSSHSEGSYTTASGENSHAEGFFSAALGNNSHAQGSNTISFTECTSASGKYNLPGGMNSADAWVKNKRYKVNDIVKASNNLYICIREHTSGTNTGSFNVQEYNDMMTNLYTVWSSLGNDTTEYAEIVGNGTSGVNRSNARTLDWGGNEVLAGKLTVGTGPTDNMDVTTKQYVDNAVQSIDLTSYATKASPAFTGSISMGRQGGTTVGLRSIAVGNNAAATGHYSGAIGNYTVADGNGAVAVGNKSEASGNNSFASGEQTIANHRSQVAFGEYNIQDPNTTYSGRGTYAEIVGNGTSNSARSNARTLDWDGNEWIAGSLTLGNTTLTEAKLQALLSLAAGGLNGTTWLFNSTLNAPSQTITIENTSGLFVFGGSSSSGTQYTLTVDEYHDDTRLRYYDNYGDSAVYSTGQWMDQLCRTITFTADVDTATPSVQAFLDWLNANATRQ